MRRKHSNMKSQSRAKCQVQCFTQCGNPLYPFPAQLTYISIAKFSEKGRFQASSLLPVITVAEVVLTRQSWFHLAKQQQFHPQICGQLSTFAKKSAVSTYRAPSYRDSVTSGHMALCVLLKTGSWKLSFLGIVFPPPQLPVFQAQKKSLSNLSLLTFIFIICGCRTATLRECL